MGLLEEYLAEVARERAAATADTYRSILTSLDTALPCGLAAANADELRAAVSAGGPMPATRALRRAAATGFFRWACDPARPRLDFDPSQFLPTVKVPRRSPRPASTDVLHHVLEHAHEPFRTWYVLAAYAGLRCCEIAALDTGHVDRQQTWVHGKGGHERVVPTHRLVWDAVRVLPAGPVARGCGGRTRATRTEVSRRGNALLARLAPEERVSMHRLRAWYATHAHRATGDIRVTQRLMGHASPLTTAGYAAVADEDMAAAVAGLPTPPAAAGAGTAPRLRSA